MRCQALTSAWHLPPSPDQLVPYRGDDGLLAVGDTQLGEDVADVRPAVERLMIRRSGRVKATAIILYA